MNNNYSKILYFIASISAPLTFLYSPLEAHHHRIKETTTGFIDNKTGDIIGTELDEYGNLRDCTIGRSSYKRALPSCNEIVNRREKVLLESRRKSRLFLRNILSGDNTFVIPNGSKIRVQSSVKYNDETRFGRGGGELIINAYVERVSATLPTFENLFIKPGSRLEISFLDDDDFELLDPLTIPLHIETGLARNVSYKKKVGLTTDDLLGIKIQARLPIRSVREYNLIKRITVAARFGTY